MAESAPTYSISRDDGFTLDGVKTFNGLSRDVIEEAPSDTLNMAAGTISFSFNADKVNGMQGLVSRDASGTDSDGGHFTSYIENGTLYVRFQNADEQVVFSQNGVKAGQDYDVIAAFGGGSVSAWVNGEPIGDARLDYNWIATDEYLQVGANGWASASGSAGYTGAFDGTISNMEIDVAEVSTPVQVTEPEPDPEPQPVVEEPIATEEPKSPPLAQEAQEPEPVPAETEQDTTNAVDDSAVAPVAAEADKQPVTIEGSNVPYTLSGMRTFDGNARTVIEEAPTDALNIEAGSVSFCFTADSVKGMNGLVSRDAKGTDENGGHFTTYIKNGTLYVRFQEQDADVVFTKSGIKAGETYDVEASFGDGVVSAQVNGQTIGEENLDYDWVDTEEYLQVGANGWASSSGSAGYMGAFDGTISDLVIESYGHEPLDPAPEPAGDAAYTLEGARAFDGTSLTVLEEAPTDALNLKDGAISFSFNADKIHGMQGLVSRDATGVDDGGGHFTSYIEKGTLYVRFQEADEEYVFTKSGIRAGEDYQFEAEFGDGAVAAWVNGELIGQGRLNYDWLDTDEYLQVGANGWASASGSAGYMGAFDGTITDLVIEAKNGDAGSRLDDMVPTVDATGIYPETPDEGVTEDQSDWFII
ncbi:MAG: LamG-like jellyroll fold domain-containing protein [Pseudomonadota bacterium]